MDANKRVPFPPPTVKHPGTRVLPFLSLRKFLRRRRPEGKLDKHANAIFCSALPGFGAKQ